AARPGHEPDPRQRLRLGRAGGRARRAGAVSCGVPQRPHGAGGVWRDVGGHSGRDGVPDGHGGGLRGVQRGVRGVLLGEPADADDGGRELAADADRGGAEGDRGGARQGEGAMIRVIEGLYLGNREDARDLVRMEMNGITHVVNCADELPNYHDGALTYLALRLRDPDPNFCKHINRTCAFIDAARKEGKGVLVHCFAAISRSPSMVLAYLCHLGDTVEAAARKLGAVAWTDPDVLFIKQVVEHRGEVVTDQEIERLS